MGAKSIAVMQTTQVQSRSKRLCHATTAYLTALALLVGAIPAWPQPGAVTPVPRSQWFDDSGNPLAAGTITTFECGTTTPKTAYTNSALSVGHSNPLTLDAAGRATIYLSASCYKFLVRNAAGSTIYTQDNIYPPFTVTTAAPVAYTPTWGNTGTANTLGNGAITGLFMQTGKLVHFSITLAFGSTTVAGSSGWTFTLPVTSAGTVFSLGTGRAINAGIASYVLEVRAASTTTVDLAVDGVSAIAQAIVNGTVPFTFGTGDSVVFNGWYWAA